MYTSISSYINYLTDELRKTRGEVLNIYCELRKREGYDYKASLQSMHNTIGSKNNTFVDSIRTEFSSPKDFETQWLKGLYDSYGDRVYEDSKGRYLYIILEMMRYPVCREYIHIFLERNYYRNINARKRYKPDESLWEIWFGSNPLFWGLLLAPVYRNGQWTNDVSEIRRANYQYWTIGHVLRTGIVAPEHTKPFTFSDIEGFITFYDQIIKRLSKSQYEKALMQMYFDYLRKSDKVETIPLLIPELRFTKETIHKYRLDFAILNPYTRQLIGFEISPQSTHMNVSGITNRTQKQLNEDIGSKWEKEMDKRNRFFKQFGITTITFTDTKLKDLEGCFDIIIEYLEMRDSQETSFEEEKEKIEGLLARVC